MMAKKLEDGSILYTGYCIDLLNELKRNLKFTYDIYSAPEGKYGIETENGTWNGMIGELLNEVCKHIVCFVVCLLNVLSPATHHLNIPSGERWRREGATSLYRLHRHMQPQRVWFFSRSGIDF